MARTSSKGTCNFCKAEFSKAGISKHLAVCPARPITGSDSGQSQIARKTSPSKTKLFHIKVEGREDPRYWMHLEMPDEATLADLDDFLRQEWLECCGHLSAFEINGQSYASIVDEAWGTDEEDMDIKLIQILSAGQKFQHEYDF